MKIQVKTNKGTITSGATSAKVAAKKIKQVAEGVTQFCEVPISADISIVGGGLCPIGVKVGNYYFSINEADEAANYYNQNLYNQ